VASTLARRDIPALLLAVIAEGRIHGYGIARRIEELTDGALLLREGSLYPALRALEHEGHVKSRWDDPGSGPARKVYVLTASGRRERGRALEEWRQYSDAVSAVLEETRR